MTVMELPMKPPMRIDWICVQRSFLFAMAFAFVFALGGWLASIRDQAADIPYKNRETSTLQQIQKQVGTNPVAAVKCAQRQAGVAMANVGQAILSAKDSAVPVPNLAALPLCPPLPKQSPPQAQKQ